LHIKKQQHLKKKENMGCVPMKATHKGGYLSPDFELNSFKIMTIPTVLKKE
jgi:hypothetical protein